MGRFTLRLPKTLHNELDLLAKGEGVSLNQYIVYALTQKVTSEGVGVGQSSENRELSPDEARLLANLKLIPQRQITEQYEAFAALLTRLEDEASDEEVEQFLAERETEEPEAELKPEAAAQFKARMAQAKQYA